MHLQPSDDGTGTHHLIDTCFKFGFRSADIYLNQTLRSAVGKYKVDKDRVMRADMMLHALFIFDWVFSAKYAVFILITSTAL
jgi:hypothetical protein